MRRTFGAAALVAGLLVAAPSVYAAVAKPVIHSRPASPTNYTYRSSRKIDMIVVHKAEGDNAAGYFQHAHLGASAHYDVHHDGSIYQSVPDHDIAWHAGNWAINERSIGIEQAGFTARNDVTDTQYRSFAKLVAWLCARHGIPVDRHHIIGHSEVPDPFHHGEFGGADHHTDPGRYWNWTHFMNLVRQYRHGSKPKHKHKPKPKPKPAPKPTPAPAPTDSGKLKGITGSLSFDPGQVHTIEVAVRNTGKKTWTPGHTVLSQDVKSGATFACPVSKTTKPGQVAVFKFDVRVPSSANPQTVTEKLAVFDSKKRVSSSAVALKIKVS